MMEEGSCEKRRTRLFRLFKKRVKKKCYFSRNKGSLVGLFALKETILRKFQRMIEHE